MDTYVTTYRKDFKWPLAPPATLKSINESVTHEDKLDPCCKEVVAPKVTKPEVYQIQLSSIPSAANTDNQPDGFLGQLYDSYPYLYNIKKGPSDDAKLDVFRKRYITTYQRDFCKAEDVEQKENIAEEDRNKCNKTDKEQLKDETRLSRLRKPTPNLPIEKTDAKKKNGEDGMKENKKLWKPQISEYADKISKTGDMILENKLLSRKPR